MTQMRDNLSLFSFWGLIFALTAVTIFVVVYVYKNRIAIGGRHDIVDDLRRHSVAVYLGAETGSRLDGVEKVGCWWSPYWGRMVCGGPRVWGPRPYWGPRAYGSYGPRPWGPRREYYRGW